MHITYIWLYLYSIEYRWISGPAPAWNARGRAGDEDAEIISGKKWNHPRACKVWAWAKTYQGKNNERENSTSIVCAPESYTSRRTIVYSTPLSLSLSLSLSLPPNHTQAEPELKVCEFINPKSNHSGINEVSWALILSSYTQVCC
jgi:hypothetical protein